MLCLQIFFQADEDQAVKMPSTPVSVNVHATSRLGSIHWMNSVAPLAALLLQCMVYVMLASQ